MKNLNKINKMMRIKKFKNQKGAVLIFGVLITSIILVIGSGVGVFMISEIVNTRKIDNSVIAYYTAECGIEQGLYEIRKKGKNINDIDLADVDVAGAGSWTRLASDKDDNVSISFLENNDIVFVNLYDPDAQDSNNVIDYHAGIDAFTIECESAIDSLSFLKISYYEWSPEISSLIISQTIPIQTAPCDGSVYPFTSARADTAYKIKIKVDWADAYNIVFKAYNSNDTTTDANLAEIIDKNVINSTGTYVGSKSGVRAEMLVDPPW